MRFSASFFSGLLVSKRFLFAFALAVSCLVIFHRLGESPLGGDDCYYSEIAREMAVTGDYLTPHFEGKVDFHTSKPPVLFWMNAAAGKLFGFNDFAMRLPSAVLGFLCVAALLFFAGRYFGLYAAFFSALVLTFTQQYLYHARSAVTDGPFAAFFAFALMAFWVARSEERPLFYYLTGLFIGLAVMTRQLAGFFIVPVIFAYILFSREFRILKNIHFYAAMIVAAAVILPWHLIMYRLHGQAFLDMYFGVTLKTGITGYPASYSANPSLNPWYAYGSILVSNYWPWLPFLLMALYRSAKGFRTFDDDRRKKMLFLFLWTFVPLLIFQAAKVKQYHYINPLYVPFALFVAIFFDSFKESAKLKTAAWLAGITGTMALVYLAFPVIPKTLDSGNYKDAVTLVPEIRKMSGEIVTFSDDVCHYNSCYIFYAGRQITAKSEGEILDLVRSGKPFNAVIAKEKYDTLKAAAGSSPFSVTKTSQKTVLISRQ